VRRTLLVDRTSGLNGPCGSWSGVFEKADLGIFCRIGPGRSPASTTALRRVVLLISRCVVYGGSPPSLSGWERVLAMWHRYCFVEIKGSWPGERNHLSHLS